jgi:hypothetical protein
MATARGKRKKRKQRKRDDPAQSRQFIKAAKEMGLEGQGDKFEDVMQKLLKPRAKRGSS